MAHDASKVVLGSTRSSIKESGNRAGTVAAGLVVRQGSDSIGVTSSLGAPVGVSLGLDMSDAGHTAIAYRGADVPVQLAASFTPVIGTQVFIDNATGKAKASATDATGVNAVYSSSIKTGISEKTLAEVPVAFIDFVGGL